MFFPWVLKFAVQGYIVCMYLHMCIMLLHVNKLQLEVHSLCGIHVYRPRAIYLLWSTGTSFYDACYYTVSHLTCKILQNSFFSFHIYIYIVFYFGLGKFSPNLFSIIFPSVIGIVKIYTQGSLTIKNFLTVIVCTLLNKDLTWYQGIKVSASL